MKQLATILFLIGALTLNAQDYPEVTIPGSHIRNITSSIVEGQEYELHILLPSNYRNSTKKYPVVYLMDSQWDFPLVKSIYGEQYYDGFIPEIIVVGVTWGGKKPNPNTLRARDYSPTKGTENSDTGGADKFLDFMKTELFPFIESNYRAKSEQRTLMGCSFGGLVTLYALFTHTDMFDGYVAASPGVGWDNESIYQFEKTFPRNNKKTVKVYMTVGDVESGRPKYEKFAATMKNNNYDNVHLISKVLENTGHSGTKCETYTRGLQYVFERKKMKLNDAILNKYVGTYKFNDNTEALIKNEDGHLVIESPQGKVTLLANTENHFYATFGLYNIHFKEQKNKVKSFDLVTFGGTLNFIKME
ncbi:alpha/beta hydrolase [Thalassobellus sediminis]|uniref:alpha/beta hydrolase n=1 Tax=Thalassobellus sediminis TaxID=3367753 RepID=UPI00378A4478